MENQSVIYACYLNHFGILRHFPLIKKSSVLGGRSLKGYQDKFREKLTHDVIIIIKQNPSKEEKKRFLYHKFIGEQK